MTFSDPFTAFVMSEWHVPEVEAIVRGEELAAVPGQVPCGLPHSLAPWPSCRAAV